MKIFSPSTNGKWVFGFAAAHRRVYGDITCRDAEMRAQARELFGNKGAGLAEMNAVGVNVPPGFIIGTAVCRDYHSNDHAVPDGFLSEILAELTAVEKATVRRFGDATNPLLLAVRSGAKVSMPGMMDTVLNLGLNDDTVRGLAVTMGEGFAQDSYRRFIQMFGTVVLGIEAQAFETVLQETKTRVGAKSDSEFDVDTLRTIVRAFKAIVRAKTGASFPQDVHAQLVGAVEAVFLSWNSRRAVFYRTMNKLDNQSGTAVVVQAMVFGNLNDRSVTGVFFTRNPNTGERKIFGEFLRKAQGEDLVAGIRNPQPIEQLEAEMPEVFVAVIRSAAQLEAIYLDVQEVEFTVENGTLFILQTRTGKRTANAAVRIAVDLADEGLILPENALIRVKSEQLEMLLVPRFTRRELAEATAAGKLLASGLAAAPGAAVGRIIFSPEESETLSASGESVILVRIDTDPEDIVGINAAKAVVTARGGMTSHAAVVARELGKPCITACDSLHIDLARELIEVGGVILRKYDVISVSGTTGEIFAGALRSIQVEVEPHVAKFLSWRDSALGN
ncbi:MAG: pyruvate, phosphate dikinase [Candidatus Melainabacteria bacterium]|nr:pyruvate, phosphate dikinase [Candidatus Melainabacteria bacterium]